jgi:gluconolactonase
MTRPTEAVWRQSFGPIARHFPPTESSHFMLATRWLSVFTCAFLSVSFSPLSANEATRSVVQPDAKLQKLAGEFRFTEGPAADAAGNVFFTDQPNDRIMRWSVDGKLSTFLQPCGRSNGLYFDRDGRLLACADEQNQLWAIDANGQHEVLVEHYQNQRLNGPNDLWVHPNGDIYFTDPFYARPYWKHQEAEQDQRGVYHLSADRKRLTRVAEGLRQPNGIIGTPNGQTLYVADISDNKTYAYRIAQDGSLTERHLFCPLGSDGMTIDEEGHVYLTGRGVIVFNAQGEKMETIEVPEPWTANVCFGGADRRTLFITASEGLYAIATRVAGARSVVTSAANAPSP